MNDAVDIAIADGSFVKSDTPVVPLTSRGLMYGDGCFETLCAYNGRFFKLKNHLERLQSGLQYLNIDYPAGLEFPKIKSRLLELLRKNNLLQAEAILRIQVWREGPRGYTTDCSASHYSVVCSPKNKTPAVCYKLASVDIKRIPSAALPAKYKFTNGLNYITAAQQARVQGADDALMHTIDGWISETTSANIFWMKDGVVFTPSERCDILPGITRAFIIDLLVNEMKVKLKIGEYAMDGIKNAETVWICNSVKQIQLVSAIDDTTYVTAMPFLDKLQHHFTIACNKECSAEAR